MAHIFKIFTFVYLFCCPYINAQSLTATDKSEKSVRRYRDVIRQNRQITDFIEYSLAQRGVPRHLRNLAIIESDLDKRTISGVGATGIWQFMAEHAQEYGLAQQDRSDIYKSTKTVASSLIHLYNIYGNWITVVAAYNCGEGNIRKAMTKARSKKYTDFAPYLPAETQNHVRKYLNACYATGELDQVLADYYKGAKTAKLTRKTIAQEPALFKKNNEPLSQSSINSSYKIGVVAKTLKISSDDIMKWNPELAENLANRGESDFYLPRNLMLDFEINRNAILNESLKK